MHHLDIACFLSFCFWLYHCLECWPVYTLLNNCLIKNKMRRLAVLSILVLLLNLAPVDLNLLFHPGISSASAANYTYNTPVVWTSTNAPTIIQNSNYFFNSDLTIEAGVRIELRGNSRIYVAGNLNKYIKL